MNKSAVITITDEDDGSVGVEIEFNPDHAQDDSIAHSMAAQFLQWLQEQHG